MLIIPMETGSAKSNSLVLDKTFDFQDCEIYHLLAHYDGFTLRFGVLDVGTQVIIGLGSVVRNEKFESVDFLHQQFVHHEILKEEYKYAALSISGLPDTLIPTAYFDEEKSKQVLAFSTGSVKEDLTFLSIPKMSATLIYSSDTSLSDVFLKKHPYGRIFLNSGLLIESMLRTNRNDRKQKIYLDIRKDSFDLFAFDKGKLVIYNQFDAETENDLLYHVLNTAQQINFDIHDTTVLVSGDIEQGDAIYQLLVQYIKNLELNSGLDDYEFGLNLKNIPIHSYMSLLNLSVCV